ncbi:hypothetical protein GYB22_09520 [bacterium]|nr:hypothetical protein [bacterium]
MVKNQQELRYVIEELLMDSALFSDTAYFAKKVFPVIEHTERAKDQDHQLEPLTANDSLILASSNQLYKEYEALLKKDFKTIFTAYRDSSYADYKSLKSQKYSEFVESDSYSRENFNLYAKKYGFEFTLLQPISIN